MVNNDKKTIKDGGVAPLLFGTTCLPGYKGRFDKRSKNGNGEDGQAFDFFTSALVP